ncbi:MAG: tetratricopeptide repeat protein [Flavitalea sp.]
MSDSLKRNIYAAVDGDHQLTAIFSFFSARRSIPIDTLFRYVVMAKKLSAYNGTTLDKCWADFYYADYLFRQGLFDSAMQMVKTYLPSINNSTQQKPLFIRSKFLLANSMVRKNQYKEGLQAYHALLADAEVQHDSFCVVMASNGIGWVNMEMQQNKNARDWFLQCLSIMKDTSFYQPHDFIYSNLASVYTSLSQLDSAEYFIKESIWCTRKTNNLQGLANALNILSDIYIHSNRNEEAEQVLKEAISIRKIIGDPYYIVSDMAQLGIFYAHLNEADKGIAICKEGIRMANELKLQSKLSILYEALAENYKAKKDYLHYSDALSSLITLKDSAYKINSADLMEEMRAKYNLQINENTVIRQKLDLAKKDYWVYASLLLLIAGIVASLILLNANRNHNRVKIVLMQETEKKLALKAVNEAEENQRKRISADLHDCLGVQANAILYGTELLQQDNALKEELINDLHDTAKDMLVTLRETLWAMKVTEANAAEVWLRVINFSKQLGRYYPSVNITTSGTVPAEFHIKPDKGLNTVLIIQEALNNSVRHSGAKNISIKSSEEDNHWVIILDDDGRGFDIDAAQQKRESYGLTNMKTRALSGGIDLSINSVENHGSVITLKITRPELPTDTNGLYIDNDI